MQHLQNAKSLLYPFNYNLHITTTLKPLWLKSLVIDRTANRNELKSFYVGNWNILQLVHYIGVTWEMFLWINIII